MITGNQIKAARALVGWSQEELASKAEVGIVTIKRFESSEAFSGTLKSLRKIEAAFANGGVLFISADTDGGPGVRLRK